MKKLQVSQRGFTVLESIVAIFILSLSISGAFSAVQQSLSQATIAKDEVKAFYLAQEAIELIRNKRDSNQVARIKGLTNTWLVGITNSLSCPFNEVCRVDAISASLVYCGSAWGSCPVLREDPSSFLYGYNASWPATNFKREIQIESVPGASDEIMVTVKIYWTKGLTTRNFMVKTHLFNWI